jgi:hypothetical protein
MEEFFPLLQTVELFSASPRRISSCFLPGGVVRRYARADCFRHEKPCGFAFSCPAVQVVHDYMATPIFWPFGPGDC